MMYSSGLSGSLCRWRVRAASQALQPLV